MLAEYLNNPVGLLRLIAISSFFLLILAILTLPILIGAIPEDYFETEKRPKIKHKHPLLFMLLWRVLKNIGGVILLIAGILMLVLPGQGILTILLGLMLMDYPGKYRLEKKLVSYPKVIGLLNWIRQKQNKPPLKTVELPPS